MNFRCSFSKSILNVYNIRTVKIIHIDLVTINGNTRKTLIALRYLPIKGEILAITVT